jgi:predicted porin
MASAGVLFAPARARAQTFESGDNSITIDGYLAGFALYNSTMGAGENKADFAGYGEVHFTAERKAGPTSLFGAYIELETNPYNDRNGSDARYLEETYVYGEGNYGRFEIGRAKNISRKAHIYAPDVGLLQIDGSYYPDYLFPNAGLAFIGSTAITTDREANKLNYISPSWGGLQIAGSHIPGSENLNGDNTLSYDRFKSGYTSSLIYKNEGFGMSLAFARFEDINTPESQAGRRSEYSAGAKYYRKGFQISASYRQIDEERTKIGRAHV